MSALFKYRSAALKLRDENYQTRNPLIRFLLHNLLKKIKRVLKEIDATSLRGLDVGCGEGHIIAYMHKEKVVGNLTAIDLNEDKLAYAREYHPFCTYLKRDVQALEFESGLFDYIIANEVFEHLPEPAKALKEIRRVAKSNAWVIISVPHEPYFRWGNLVRGKYWGRGGRTPSHVNFWTRTEFKNFINKFADIHEEYYFSIFPWMLYLGRFRR